MYIYTYAMYIYIYIYIYTIKAILLIVIRATTAENVCY